MQTWAMWQTAFTAHFQKSLKIYYSTGIGCALHYRIGHSYFNIRWKRILGKDNFNNRSKLDLSFFIEVTLQEKGVNKDNIWASWGLRSMLSCNETAIPEVPSVALLRTTWETLRKATWESLKGKTRFQSSLSLLLSYFIKKLPNTMGAAC